MGEIKSAFEKALERAERLGKLSPEEMRERKKAEDAQGRKVISLHIDP